jgi:thioredoxin 2
MATSTVTCPNCGKRNRIGSSPEGIPRCGNCHEPLPWIVDADAGTFDEEIRATVPVLIDFWAPWCGPCRMVTPAVESLARERKGKLKVVKLDIDGAPAIAARYQVQGIPLLVLLRDGEEADRLVGAAPPAQLTEWLGRNLAAAGAGAAG